LKELLNEVETSVFMEYQRAAEKFGIANNSAHESYAVLLEEFEEAKTEAEKFEAMLGFYWHGVKKNDVNICAECLPKMQEMAIRAAAEWIQVAAMCYKARIEPEANT